jgi:hypothetical protein
MVKSHRPQRNAGGILLWAAARYEPPLTAKTATLRHPLCNNLREEIRAPRRTVHVSLQLEYMFSYVFYFFSRRLCPFRLDLTARIRRNAQGKWNAEASLENRRPLQFDKNFVRNAGTDDSKLLVCKKRLSYFFCMRSFNAKMTSMFWLLCCLDASTRTSGAGQLARRPAAQHLTKT